jgi:hypothetical protein
VAADAAVAVEAPAPVSVVAKAPLPEEAAAPTVAALTVAAGNAAVAVAWEQR